MTKVDQDKKQIGRENNALESAKTLLFLRRSRIYS